MDSCCSCRCHHTVRGVDMAAQVSDVGDDWYCGVDVGPSVCPEPLTCLSVGREIVALGGCYFGSYGCNVVMRSVQCCV